MYSTECVNPTRELTNHQSTPGARDDPGPQKARDPQSFCPERSVAYGGGF